MAAVQRVMGITCRREGKECYSWEANGQPWRWQGGTDSAAFRHSRRINAKGMVGPYCLYDAVLFSLGYEAGRLGTGMEAWPG